MRRRTGGAHTRRRFRGAHASTGSSRSALDYRGVTVHEIPPNGQGIAALIALGILRAFRPRSLPPDSVASQHLQIEAMKLAFADAYRYVGDHRARWTFRPSALLDRGYLACARAADRSHRGRRISEPAIRRAAARFISAPPTPAG